MCETWAMMKENLDSDKSKTKVYISNASICLVLHYTMVSTVDELPVIWLNDQSKTEVH